jgi:predicted MFS family arabinose efflux permease
MFSGAQFADIGWRIAFAIGALVLPFGFIIRSTLPETLHHAEARLEAHPARADLRGHLRIILLGLGLIAGGTVSTYVFSFMTTYAQQTLHLGVGISFSITVATGSAGFVASLAGGALSDRVGRRPLLIWPRLAFLLAIIPVFVAVIHYRTGPVLLGLLGGLNFVGNLAGVPALVAVTESLRKEIRSVGVAAIYATAVSIFGGTTQFVVAWLDEVTHNPLAIAWYLVAATCVALFASVLMRESAGPRVSPSR